jgi:hypothetical protein
VQPSVVVGSQELEPKVCLCPKEEPRDTIIVDVPNNEEVYLTTEGTMPRT